MAKSVEILRDNLGEHPAVRAWSATGPERVEPKSVAVLKKWTRHQKSGVYRLAGVGPGGAAVIAKLPCTAAVSGSFTSSFRACRSVAALLRRRGGRTANPGGCSWKSQR
jgi:hypothetical protein